MNIIANLIKLWKPRKQKNLPMSSAILAMLGLQDYTKWPIQNYKKYASEGYIACSTVYSCINKIAQYIGDIDLLTYAKKGKDYIEIESPLLGLIEKPNPKEKTKARFMRAIVSYLLISGNCYIYQINVGSSKQSKELWLLRPDSVQKDSNGNFIYTTASERKIYTPEQVEHITLFNPFADDYGYGLSPVQTASLAIDQNTSSKTWNVKLLERGTPPGALKTTEELSDPSIKEIKRRYIEHNTGADNAAGVPIILEGGLDWINMGISPRDMEYIIAQKMTVVDITSIFGVPPELIGYPEFRTYNNVREATSQFYQGTVLPLMKLILEDLNSLLSNRFGGAMLQFDPDKIQGLQDDVDALWTRLIRAKNNGLLSPNEARLVMGYEPFEGGQYIYGRMGEYPIAATDGSELPAEEEEGPMEEEPIKMSMMESKTEANIFLDCFVKSKEEKQIYLKAVNTIRDAWVKPVRSRVMLVLQNEIDRVIAAIEESNDGKEAIDKALKAINKSKPLWEKALQNIYFTVGKDMRDRIWEELPKKGLVCVYEEKLIEDIWADEVQIYLKKISGKKIKDISTTSRNTVRKQLAHGIADGESMGKLAERIKEFVLPTYKHRAETIARTEIGAAAGLGGQTAAKETGLELNKSWLSFIDSETRGQDPKDEFDHVLIDGQTVAVDEPYEVNGEEMMFPLDGSMGASAGNIVNCRCSETYEVR